MSFNSYKEFIEYGDTVVIFLSVSKMYTLVVSAGGVFQTKFGAVKHDDLVGKQYGSLVTSSSRGSAKKGWVHVLHPTPELWTLTLPHRTQILYATDISVITFQLDLKPGKVVCESGTGSGSLSHAILRNLAPDGHLHTFDFHEERVRLCRQEFDVHGVGHLVTTTQRDVVQDGFGLTDVADAVFLDLPLPWDVIPSAKLALKRTGGRICSFSPCIEQVQNTCEALAAHGFRDIKTLECLQRPLDVRARAMPSLPLAVTEQELKACKTISPSDLESSMDVSETINTTTTPKSDTKPATSVSAEQDENSAKRKKPWSRGGAASWSGAVQLDDITARAPGASFFEAQPSLIQVGHTGYLTFATLPPSMAVSSSDGLVVAPLPVTSVKQEANDDKGNVIGE